MNKMTYDENARWIINCKLYPDNGKGSVKETVMALFGNNAAGKDWKSVHNNFETLVDFCLETVDKSSTYKGDVNKLHHFYDQMNGVVNLIEQLTQSCIEIDDRKRFEDIAERGKKLYETATSTPEKIIIWEHFKLVKDGWNMLNDSTFTYRYLADLAMMVEFYENERNKKDLCDIIHTISVMK